MAKRSGRNDPCWCDSGLKYKRCHFDLDRQEISLAPSPSDRGAVGSFGGYDVHVLGERPRPDLRQRWPIPHGTLETADPEEVFRARVEPFSLDSIVSLTAELTRQIWKDSAKFKEAVERAGRRPGTVFLPFLLRRLVTQAIAGRSLTDTAEEVVDVLGLAAAERILIDIAAVRDRQARSTGDIGSVAMRLLQAQFHDQLGSESYMRELWLNLKTVEGCLAAGLDLDAVYKAHFGLTYQELAALCFAAHAHVTEGNGVIDTNLWFDNRVVDVGNEVVDAFFQLTVSDYQKFQEIARTAEYSEPGFEPYAFSPLISTPLIRRDSGTCVAPIARDLLERPTRGFTIDALRAIDAHEPKRRGTYSDVSGSVYEDYVRSSLNEASGTGEVKRGTDVLSVDEMNCDFICVEPEGLTLVEAKAVRFRLKADMTKQHGPLMEEMKRTRLGHGLAQLQASADKIAEADTSVPTGLPLVGLLVVRGEEVLVNFTEFRSLLEQLAAEELGRPVTVSYQVTNDEGFSSLVRLCVTGQSLYEFLSRKIAEPRSKHEDLHNTINREIEHLPSHPLQDEIHRAFENLQARFFKGLQASDVATLVDPTPAGST